MDLTLLEVNRRKTRKAYIDQNGSIFLECGKCKEIKSIDDYYNHKKNGWFGKKTDCKQCHSLPIKKKRQESREDILKETVTINGNTQLSVIDVSNEKRKLYIDKDELKYLECTGCNTIKSVDKFNNQSKGWNGKASECKDCMGARRKILYKNNLGKEREERLNSLMNESATYNGHILTVVKVNQKRTRKAYENELGEFFLTCGECEEIKPFDSYINSNKGFYQKEAICYDCRRKQYYKYEVLLDNVVIVGNVKLTVAEVSERGRRKLTDDNGNVYIDCTNCKDVKPAKDFRERDYFLAGRDSICLVCDRDKSKEWRNANFERYIVKQKEWVNNNRERIRLLNKRRYYNNWDHIRNQQREYREKDPERYREHGRKWARENSDYQVHLTRKRRAKIRRLPYDLTTEQRDKLLAGGCCLTGNKDNIHLDHVIPLAIGHGGTIFSNMIALRGDLNNSKQALNIFEWAKTNHIRLGFTLERFNEVMNEVAKRNGMTLVEYKKYVFWCFENPHLK
ncbi:hypothetical protein [Peribacillus frigoritolerans]|uniref:hypothetical protein n=1 Tax=Peribacillus frigoritolerans TaxID=450367 RepID=UPI0022305AEA|nr:hypothetical protein [Peribacillus frigoritolerans]UZD48720.1 hypothetical protein OMJ04_09735 [Peribacillus frigoritolerans]